MRHYYARQSPRGFVNNISIHQFATRADRDAWVDAHADDGDCNSAYCGAEACTASDARAILRQQGDAVTEQYHALYGHRDGEVEECEWIDVNSVLQRVY